MQIALILLVTACSAFALSLIPARKPLRAARWWPLEPIAPNCDPEAAELAVKGMGARRRKAVATLARIGHDGGRPELWLGVSAPRKDQAAVLAKRIAEAGCCKLGDSAKPPRLPTGKRRWWSAVPEVVDAEWHDKMLMQISPVQQRELVATFCATFPEQVDSVLCGGDAWVVSFAPHKGSLCAAKAMSTNPELGEAWAGGSQEMWVYSWPSLLAVLAGVSGAGGLILFLAGLNLVSVPGVNSSAAAVIGCMVCAVGLTGCWISIFRSRSAKRIEQFWHLPVGRKRSRKGREWSSVPSGLVAGWVSGGESTTVQAHTRSADDDLIVPSGVRVGADEQGRDCYLSDHDRQYGFFCVGTPGSGKTTMLLNLLRGDVLAQQAGKKIGAVWIETKGEGAQRAQQVIQDAGGHPVVLKAAASEGPRLELIDWDDPERSAKLLVDSMRYAFEADAIQDRSVDVLTAAFRCVLTLPPQAVREMGFSSGRPDVMQAAWRLLGGGQQNRLPQQARAIAEKYAPNTYNSLADYLPPHISKRDSEQVTMAPRNKVAALSACVGLFAGYDRQWASLDQIVDQHWAVVLDLSPAYGGAYTETTAQQTAAIAMFCLWDTIKRICHDWQAQDRSVAVYSDELHDVAGFGDFSLEVVESLAVQGRSRGVLPVFGTQYFNQLRPKTQEAIRNFGSLVVFRIADVEVARTASDLLREVYSADEISALETGMGAARLSCNSKPRPAFTLRPDNL